MTPLRVSHRLRQLSFRRRLILLSTAAVAAAVVLASGVAFLVARNELRGQVDERLRDLVDNLSIPAPPQLGISPSANGPRFFVLPSEPLGRRAGYAQVVEPDGTVIQPRGVKVDLPVTKRTLTVASGQSHSYFTDETVGQEHVRVFTTPIQGGAVQAARSLEEVDSSLRKLGFALALISLAGIALAVWLGRLVARAAMTPVNQLTEAAEHVARTRDLSRRMAATGSDELSRLGSSFNTMLEALEASQSAQRQLVADASHELRTPLTSLRTNIEVLADAESLSAEDRSKLLRDVVGQLDELTTLVTDLVDLARGDEPELEAEDLRLDLLVSDAVERARRYANGKRFAVDLEPCLVHGIAARLDRAVSNLLDNALKWSPPGGVIDVGVSEGEISVRDRGPGIAPADLPFVFDRFYRAPSARGLPGSGLGLAIVRQVAESHGGSVSVEAPEGGGARLVLRIPLLDAAEPAPPPRSPASRAT